MRAKLDITVYAKPHELRLTKDMLERPALRTEHMLRVAARDQDLILACRRLAWPVMNSYALPGNGFRFLEAEKYNADAAVLVVPRLDQVSLELPHLLYRKRQDLHHVFVVCSDRLPERDKSADLYRGLTTFPEKITLKPTSQFLDIIQSDPNDAEARGDISFHTLHVAQEEKTLRRLSELLALIRYHKDGTMPN